MPKIDNLRSVHDRMSEVRLRKLFFLFVLICIAGCSRGGSYNSRTARQLTPEAMKMSGLAQQIEDKTNGLVKQAPPELAPNLASFAENAARFNNSAQRFGPRSLEARDAYDKLFYQQNQIDPIMTEKNYPNLVPMWQSIKQDILAIGKELGYKVHG